VSNKNFECVEEEMASGLAWDAVRNFNGAQSRRIAVGVQDEVGPVYDR